MKIDQALINRIITRAKASGYGLDAEPKTALTLESYSQENLESLALILVTAFEAKYDLVSVFKAALEEVHVATLLQAAEHVGRTICKNHPECGSVVCDVQHVKQQELLNLATKFETTAPVAAG